jgi:hypothetical protein
MDLAEAIKEIFSLRPACWNLLNSAHIVLIEKKEGEGVNWGLQADQHYA